MFGGWNALKGVMVNSLKITFVSNSRSVLFVVEAGEAEEVPLRCRQSTWSSIPRFRLEPTVARATVQSSAVMGFQNDLFFHSTQP